MSIVNITTAVRFGTSAPCGSVRSGCGISGGGGGGGGVRDRDQSRPARSAMVILDVNNMLSNSPPLTDRVSAGPSASPADSRGGRRHARPGCPLNSRPIVASPAVRLRAARPRMTGGISTSCTPVVTYKCSDVPRARVNWGFTGEREQF